MMQVLFRIPFLNWPIYGYGLMMVLGFFLAAQLCCYLAKRCGLNPDTFMNAALLGLITGIVGARVSHVLENLPQYTDSHRTAFENLKDAANISSGGLTYYGGFLLAFPSLVIYAIRNKVPLRLGMDIIAPGLMVGLALGRVGCLLNGCCYGAVCQNSWSPTIRFPYYSIAYQEEFMEGKLNPPEDLLKPAARVPLQSPEELKRTSARLVALARAERSLPLIPAQIYSTITALLIAAFCVANFTVPHKAGHIFAAMMMIEGLTRYLLEIVRAEPPVTYVAGYGFSLSMLLGIGLLGFGAVLWAVFSRMRPEEISVPIVGKSEAPIAKPLVPAS